MRIKKKSQVHMHTYTHAHTREETSLPLIVVLAANYRACLIIFPPA